MFKTRGTPEDPWNKAAAEQERDLVEAIHVSQIRKNGRDQHLEKFVWSPTAHQRALTRRHNHSEQIKMCVCQDKLRRCTTSNQLSKDLKEINRNRERACSHYQGSYHNKPVILKAPLGKTKNVKPTCRSANVASTNKLPVLKEIEKLEERLLKIKNPVEESLQMDFVQELEEANLEVNVGNAQLEEINKMLKAAKLKENKMWNVARMLGNVRPDEFLQNANQRKQEDINYYSMLDKNGKCVNKKSKLLLTLNDVNQRIQEMQAKFFSNNRPRYRSAKIKNLASSNKSNKVEALYKNKQYAGLSDRKLIEEDLRLLYNLEAPFDDQESIQNSISTDTLPDQSTSLVNVIGKKTSKVDFVLPHLNLNDNDVTKELTDQATSPVSYNEEHSPTIFIDNDNNDGEKYEKEEIADMSIITNKNNNDDVAKESTSNSDLQKSILKSDFLMREFDINPDLMHFDISKMSSILESNRKTLHIPECIVQRLGRDNAKIKNKKLRFPTTHYVLKDTLYCTEEEQ